MKTQAWDVFVENECGGRSHIDTVFFDADCDADYVRRALIEHDGYDPRIEVEKS